MQALRTTEDFRQFLKIPNSNLYTAWNPQNQLMAYAVEGKGIDLVNYVHEWGGQVEALTDLFHYVQKKKQSPLTIMTPYHCKNLHQKLDALNHGRHEGFLGMLKFIQLDQVLAKVKKAFRAEGHDNVVFEMQDQKMVFGFGNDLYTLNNEADIMQLVFGPLEAKAMDFISPESQEKLSQLLPLPLWIWGWDSI